MSGISGVPQTNILKNGSFNQIAAGVPFITANSGVSGNAIVGQTLTIETISVLNTVSTIYQWVRYGGSIINGATSSTYTQVTADIGSFLGCSVTLVGLSGKTTTIILWAQQRTVPNPDIVVDGINGQDAWPGTIAQPLKTFEAAKTAMRALIAANANMNRCVLFRAGDYRLSATSVFNLLDDPNNSYTVSWMQWPGEKATISGGVDLTNFFIKSGSLWKINLATNPNTSAKWAGGWRPTFLDVGGLRAEWPTVPERGKARYNIKVAGTSSGTAANDAIVPANFGDAVGIISKSLANGNADIFGINAGEFNPSWTNLTDIFVRTADQFHDSLLKIKSVNGTTIQLDSHTLNDVLPVGTCYRFENVKEALAPGLSYLDRTTGDLFYYPRPNETIGVTKIIAPYLDQILRISGVPADNSGSTSGVDVQGINFRLKFSHTESPASRVGYIGGFSNMFSLPLGAIEISGATNIVFDGCEFDMIGETAIVDGVGGYGNSIKNCTFRNLGAGAAVHAAAVAINLVRYPDLGQKIPQYFRSPNWHITVSDPALYYKQDNFIFVNNLVDDYSRVIKLSAGVFVFEGRGHLINQNTITNGKSCAIHLGQNFQNNDSLDAYGGNEIGYNFINKIGYENGVAGAGLTQDYGAIYSIGPQSATYNGKIGLRIHHNLVRNVKGAMSGYDGVGKTGIDLPACYCDDYSDNRLVEYNWFESDNCGPMMKGGQVKGNVWNNNVFILDFGTRKNRNSGGNSQFRMIRSYYSSANAQTSLLYLEFKNNIVLWRTSDDATNDYVYDSSMTLNQGLNANITMASLTARYSKNIYCKLSSVTGKPVSFSKISLDLTPTQWRAIDSQHDNDSFIGIDPQLNDPWVNANGSFDGNGLLASLGIQPVNLTNNGVQPINPKQ